MKLVIVGPPRTKKNGSNIAFNPRTKRSFIAPDKVKAAYQKSAVEQLVSQMSALRLPSYYAPVHVRVTFYREKNLGDLVNYMQMIADVLEKAGIVENDKWIMSWDGSRLDKDAANPRTELEVTAL